ncbi:MAG: hypothetical protein OEZ39_02330 [Gammaproteobacteria bacterium]|nr:hypothetical protein [Gammaproteobacteria bacterium]MDH5650691.1 hypothetical protein [Gammaproteobacteria bacterium]
MWETLSAKLAPIFVIFMPITTGIIIGVSSRGKYGRATEKKMAALCEGAALKGFLPFFVIESIHKTTLGVDLVLGFIIGFLLPLLAYLGMLLYGAIFTGKQFLPPRIRDLRILTATYGGGNRGTALFVLLFAASAHYQDYLKWFAIVDLGNFICLLLIISWLIAKQYGTPALDNKGLLQRLLSNYAVTMVLLVGFYFILVNTTSWFEAFLAETVEFRKVMFSFFVFMAIALRFEHGTLKNFFIDLLAFFSARIFTAVVTLLLLMLLSLTPFLTNFLPIYLAVIILLLMPPSSFVPSMFGGSKADDKTLGYVNGFTAAVNVFYLGLIVLGVVSAIVQVMQ